jgi:two-component system, NtrC family, response regulator AtoC
MVEGWLPQEATVLVADDDEGAQGFLVDLLTSAGIPAAQVLAARCGEDAVALLSSRRVDLVITDYRMPRMNGLQLLTWLAQHQPWVGRVLVTGWDERLVTYDAFRVGRADAVLPKPLDGDLLLRHAHRLLLRAHPPGVAQRVRSLLQGRN